MGVVSSVRRRRPPFDTDVAPPVFHPTSSCSWGWRWVVCVVRRCGWTLVPWVGSAGACGVVSHRLGVPVLVSRDGTRDPPYEQRLVGIGWVVVVPCQFWVLLCHNP